MLAVTTTPKAWRGTLKVVGDRRRVRVALGLHPELVAQRHGEVALLCGLIGEARYVGEIGLDGSPPHRASMDLQKTVLDRILGGCAKQGGRILSLHSRGAADQVVDALERQPAAGTPILHWFSGTRRQLDRAIRIGCWFSVGPAMLRSANGRALAAAMPLDRMLTETDAPFARSGDRPLFPWEAARCVPDLAALHGLSESDVAQRLQMNLAKLASTKRTATP